MKSNKNSKMSNKPAPTESGFIGNIIGTGNSAILNTAIISFLITMGLIIWIVVSDEYVSTDREDILPILQPLITMFAGFIFGRWK